MERRVCERPPGHPGRHRCACGCGVYWETRRERNSGRITGTKSDKTVVQVLLDEKTPGTTEVRAKVGALGERTGSERVLDDIQRSLQKAPPTREATGTGR